MATCFGRIAAIFVALIVVCFIVVVYDVNLYIIIIVTQRDGFRKNITKYLSFEHITLARNNMCAP